MADNRTAGERLQALMELRDISQNMLALRSGVKQRTISGIITGNSPRLDTAAALADALDISLDWLAGRKQKQPAVLSPDQQVLLEAYAQLDEAHREAVLDLARSLAGRK